MCNFYQKRNSKRHKQMNKFTPDTIAMIKNFRSFEKFSDVKLHTIDGHEFPVHRVILAKKSKFFRRLMCGSQYQPAEVFVPNIRGSVLEIILNYIYNRTIHFTVDNIKDILVAAKFLGLEELLHNCTAYALNNLTIRNSIPLFLEGIKDEKLGILKATSRFIELNFERIITDNHSRFQDLSAETLKLIISSISLNISDERQVWGAIEGWINYLPEVRKKYLNTLIPCIRFQDTSSDFKQDILNHPFVKEEPSHIDVIEKACSLSLQPNQRLPKKLYIVIKSFISRLDNANGIKIFATYDENIDIWHNLNSKRVHPDVILHGSGPFVLMFQKALNVIHTFNILLRTWSFLPSTIIPRCNYNLVKLGNYVYAVGGILRGQGIFQKVSTLERYNFDSEAWELAASHEGIIEGIAATVDNKIILIGIPDFYSEEMSAQLYDPEIEEWRTINPPKVYRHNFELVVYTGKLFILGGSNNEGYIKQVEFYDLRRDVWEDFESLPFPYISAKAIAIEDVLYVYEEYSNKRHKIHRRAVLWNQINQSWTKVEDNSAFNELWKYKFSLMKDSAVIRELRRGNTEKWVESPFFAVLNS